MKEIQTSNTLRVQSVSFTYEGYAIKFVINGNVMICATGMARPFGKSKEPKHWLKLQSSKEFLCELSKVKNLTLPDLVQVKYGGLNPGTWFHDDVAIEFARWLSPRFGIWCNDRVKEILYGKTYIYATPQTIDVTDKDREIAKWKSCFDDAMEIVKSMHESNKLAQRSFEMLWLMSEGGKL